MDKPQSSSSAEDIDLLAYPAIGSLEDTPEMKGRFVYPIRRYSMQGVSALVSVSGQTMGIKFGDWDGNVAQDGWEHESIERKFIAEYANHVGFLMGVGGINTMQFYLSVEEGGYFRLVDARYALDRMVGPGFLQEIFGVILPTQEVVGEPRVLDDDLIAEIQDGKMEDLILKPSAFKVIERGNALQPLYARTWQ